MSNGVAKVIYDTAAGKAVSIGFNRYQIIEGVNIGKIYRREQTVGGYVYIYVTTLCPVGYKSVIEGFPFNENKCVKEVVNVACPEGQMAGSGGNCTPCSSVQYWHTVKNQCVYQRDYPNVKILRTTSDGVKVVDGTINGNGNGNGNGNETTQTNWLLYGAIALGAYLLLSD